VRDGFVSCRNRVDCGAWPGSAGQRAIRRPQPGDVFREYLWTNAGGDAGGALRVGGRVGYGGGPVALPHAFDLEHALRAEIVLEKLLCHDGKMVHGMELNWPGVMVLKQYRPYGDPS
jgi:hypothetical protein